MNKFMRQGCQIQIILHKIGGKFSSAQEH
jgi:hypothetical protein